MANMFINYDFEVDSTHWDSNGAFGTFLASSWVRDTSKAHGGAASLKVTWPNPSGSTASWVNHDPLTVVNGRVYRFTAWVYVPTGAPDVRQKIAFYGDQGAVCSVKDQWTQLTWDFLATGTSVYAGIATVGAPILGTQMWVDDVYCDLLVDNSQQPSQGPLPEVTMEHWINRGAFNPALSAAAVTGFGAGRLTHLRQVKTGAGFQQMLRQQWPMP